MPVKFFWVSIQDDGTAEAGGGIGRRDRMHGWLARVANPSRCHRRDVGLRPEEAWWVQRRARDLARANQWQLGMKTPSARGWMQTKVKAMGCLAAGRQFLVDGSR